MEPARATPDVRGGVRSTRLDGAPLAALAGAGRLPGPPLARSSRAQRADVEGADVRSDGGAAGGGDDVAAGDTGWRAELGLPLQLDPRLDVRSVGAVHARLRLGGERLLL